MTKWTDIAVIVVTWNSAKWIGGCLEALAKTRYEGNLTVIVVDNASSDDSHQITWNFTAEYVSSNAGRSGASSGKRIEWIMICENENLGFGGANNQGWQDEDAEAPIIVFLNPDTEVTPDWLTPIAERFESSPDTAIIGCKLLFPSSSESSGAQGPSNPSIIQHAGGIIYDNGMTDHIGTGQEDRGQYDRPLEMDYVTGAAMAVRRTLLEEAGGFDDLFYPAYFEETDLCAQAHARGLKVVYEPRSVVIHHESTSLTRGSRRFIRFYARGRAKFLMKHFSAADWLCRFLPFELRWFRWRQSREEYGCILLSYAGALIGKWKGKKKA
ncbi:MAG: glycosyltransferase family 2 protein [Candidatus Sumerlaeota bacterium]|nr:glycosyltransferase family 2 protein [Candidatus Sumerlaeota bacterium]